MAPATPIGVGDPNHRCAARGVAAGSCSASRVSGFVAIGYEIIWSKVFGIVMKGTLYGFATVLAGGSCSVSGLGSAAISTRVDRLRQPARGLRAGLHLAIAVAVAVGMYAGVPYLPYAYERLGARARAAATPSTGSSRWCSRWS